MKRTYALLLLSLFVFLISCNANFSSLDPDASPGLAMKIVPPATASTSSPTLSLAAGNSTATTLHSFKIHVVSILLASNATISGSGFSTPKDPMMVMYGEGWGKTDAKLAEWTKDKAVADAPEWIDLMKESDVSRLQSTVPVTTDNVGTYSFVLFSVGKYARIKASINTGSKTIYTKSSYSNGSIGGFDNAFATTRLTNGPAEEMLFDKAGGNWYRLLKPFRVTDEDLRNKTKFKLLLAFDPVGCLNAYDQAAANLGGGVSVSDFLMRDTDGVTNYIVTPGIDFAAVVYKEGQTVRRSTYQATLTKSGTPGMNYDLRWEVFTVDEDSGAIYACITRALPNNSGYAPGLALRISEVSSSGGSYTFYSPSENSKFAYIAGFTTLSTVGDTGKINFTGGPNGDSTVNNVTYSLIERKKVN